MCFFWFEWLDALLACEFCEISLVEIEFGLDGGWLLRHSFVGLSAWPERFRLIAVDLLRMDLSRSQSELADCEASVDALLFLLLTID